MTEWTPTDTIPRTKLRPPQLSDNILHRAELVDALYRAVTNQRLTLLSAPAGAGKTTAVTALHAAHPKLTLAWAALDAGDSNPHTFLQLIIAAVQQQWPEYGHRAQAILAAGDDQTDFRRLLGLLINDFAAHIDDQDAPLLLVLDDFHRVDNQTIHSLLDYLLERMPPRLHLLLTTRHDPPLRLAQLRARGHLAEFRLDALRFSPTDVTRLFKDVIGLDLTPDDLALIEKRTAGWAAGVRLLTLSLTRLDTAASRSNLIRHLSGSHRYLFDYLIEEVLNQLDDAERDFLLQTAILDELTPTLCQAVTNQPDTAAILDTLYRQNLFLVVSETADPLDEPTYRYHALFAQFLQKQLRQRPDLDAAALHRRAAAAVTAPERRIHHLLAAAAWPAAAEAIIAVAKPQCEREFVRPQVIDWLRQLPEAVRADHYWLDLIEASYCKQRGELSQAWQLAHDAYSRAEAAGDVGGEMEALWTLGSYMTEQTDPDLLAHFNDLLSNRMDLLPPLRRVSHLISKAWQAANGGDWPSAQQHFAEYLRTAAAAGDVRVYYAAAQHIGPQWLFTDAGMAPVTQFDQTALRLLGDEDGLPQAGVFIRRGWMQLLRGDLDAAIASAERAGRIFNTAGTFAWMSLVVDWLLMIGMLARAEYGALADFVSRADARLQAAETHRSNLTYYWMAQWRAHWLQGQWEAAQTVQAKIETAVPAEMHKSSKAIAIMAGWQAAAERPSTAADYFMAALRQHRRLPWIGTWGHPGLDLALFYLETEQPQAALDAWRETAVELKQRNMPGQPLLTGRKVIPLLETAVQADVYADVAQVALDALGVSSEPQPLPIPGSDEWLTPREVEVLHLLKDGATNREIAAALVITKRTAKAHVSNIMQKLQVSSRTEAVARAYELSLFR